MVYSCGKCRFAFERVSEPERCPDCGSLAIHPADEAERGTTRPSAAPSKRKPLAGKRPDRRRSRRPNKQPRAEQTVCSTRRLLLFADPHIHLKRRLDGRAADEQPGEHAERRCHRQQPRAQDGGARAAGNPRRPLSRRKSPFGPPPGAASPGWAGRRTGRPAPRWTPPGARYLPMR